MLLYCFTYFVFHFEFTNFEVNIIQRFVLACNEGASNPRFYGRNVPHSKTLKKGSCRLCESIRQIDFVEFIENVTRGIMDKRY